MPNKFYCSFYAILFIACDSMGGGIMSLHTTENWGACFQNWEVNYYWINPNNQFFFFALSQGLNICVNMLTDWANRYALEWNHLIIPVYSFAFAGTVKPVLESCG